jgi:cation diffusion facilitator family transporter
MIGVECSHRMSAPHDLASHAHHEDEDHFNRSGERKTILVVLLAFAMMLGEVIVGRFTNSLALEADGWHMGTHVGALGLTLLAYWYARTRATHDEFSFGTGKVYALAGYTSGVLLVLVALWMGKEGIERLIENEAIDYGEALPVAILGLVVNGLSALILGTGHTYGHGHSHGHDHHHGHGHDHGKPKAGTLDFNMRAAYIHILADAMTSLLAIGALTIGSLTDVKFLDPMMGVIAAVVITWWAVGLCRQASRQLLDVVSSPAHEAVVRQRLEAIDDVKVADLHVWELGPNRRSCIVSLVTSTPRDVAFYRDTVLDALEVAHLTIEIHQCGLAHPESQGGVAVAHHHDHGHHGHDH